MNIDKTDYGVDYSDYSYKSYEWDESGRHDKAARPMRSKQKKRGKTSELFGLIAIVVCFLITFYLSGIFSTEGILAAFDTGTTVSKSYFAVYVDSYENSIYAAVTSDDIRTMGGAGYLLNDGNKYLIAAVYGSESAAESVANNLTSYKSGVYKMEISDTSLEWCKNADKKNVITALGYADIIFNELYSISVSLDKKEITDAQAKAQIEILYSQIEKLKSDFDQLSQYADIFEYAKIKVELTTALSILQALYTDGLSSFSLLSDIRYSIVLILDLYKNLTIKI